ncbi:hypothetical protein FOZ62_029060, partial [Perkinsus olseni]
MVNGSTLRVTPTILDGENLTIGKIEAWFRKYKTISAFYQWDTPTSVNYLTLFFEGSVSTAYDCIPEKSRTDLDSIKANLIKSLLTTDPYEAFRSRVLVPSETFRDYVADLVHLANRMISSNGDVVSNSVIDGLARAQFLSGIPVDVADKLRVLQLGTLEELVQRAEIVANSKSDDEPVQGNAFYSNYGQRVFGKGKGYRGGKGGKGGYGKGFGTRYQGGKGFERGRSQEDKF